MCGIFCHISDNSSNLELKSNFERIQKRGPDYSILQHINNITLGFHRLAINDLSDLGNQPFSDNNIYLICNGEIYNHKTLREKYNIKTNSNSDCEVILYMYQKIGFENTCNELDGVFSLIIYDININKVFVGRDPYGVRPLFIGYDESNEIFLSSELKSIHDLTIYTKQFTPGYYLEYDIENKTSIYKNYYDYNLKIEYSRDINFILEGIRNRLTNSVKKRLLSDRPIGALLSGGLDSSLICGIISKIYKENKKGILNTFAIGIKGATDLKYSSKVAEYIGSKHHQVECEEEDFINAIPEVIKTIESYDTTSVRASVGNYLIAKYIKENTDIVVVFNGDGSDEVLGGYYYMRNAPSSLDFQNECVKLLREIHFFDGLRSDRSVSSEWSLEARTPFLDKEFVKYFMNIDPELKMYSEKKQEKYLLRKAFESENLIPRDILWRPKEAFSDGCSSETRSWHKIIQEYLDGIISDEEFTENKDKYKFNTPMTKESYYYRKLFEEYYPHKSNVIPHFWLPNWSSGTIDPSARELKDKRIKR